MRLGMSPEDRVLSAASSHRRTPAAAALPRRPGSHTWRERGRVGRRGGGGEVLTRGWASVQQGKLPQRKRLL